MAKLKRYAIAQLTMRAGGRSQREAGMVESTNGAYFQADEACAVVRQWCRERLNDLRARRVAADDAGKNALRAGLNEAIQEIMRMQNDLCYVLGAGNPHEEEERDNGPPRDKRGLADPEGGPCE